MEAKLPHNYINIEDLKQLGVTSLRLDNAINKKEPGNYPNQLNIPYILISGNYKDEENSNLLCKLLGGYLSKFNVGIVSGSGKSGSMVSYSFFNSLIEANTYDPDKIIFFRRMKEKIPRIEVDTIGVVKFYGSLKDMRQAMVLSAMAAIVIGGKYNTKKEEHLANLKNIPVIPIARTGGTALEIWEKYKNNPDAQSLSVQQFDPATFDALNNKHIHFAVDAAIALLKTSIRLLTVVSYGVLINLS